jgi:hypothetical protein
MQPARLGGDVMKAGMTIWQSRQDIAADDSRTRSIGHENGPMKRRQRALEWLASPIKSL